MTGTDVQPQRTNRRGDASRENMLEAALKALATGDPGAVSANRIAKQIGATWGVVKYQFGDADGLWAAVLQRTAEHRADVFVPSDTAVPLRQRVAAIIDTLYDGLTATDSRAIENLRAALPRDPAELERLYPRTSAELQSWGRGWLATCQNAFAGLARRPGKGARCRHIHSRGNARYHVGASARQLLRPRPGAAGAHRCDRGLPGAVRVGRPRRLTPRPIYVRRVRISVRPRLLRQPSNVSRRRASAPADRGRAPGIAA